MIHFPKLLLLSLFLFAFTACQQTNEQTESNQTETSINMLQHTVYFYLNEDVTDEEVAQFEEGLKDLVAIETVYKSEIGVPGSTEDRDVTDHSFGYSIFTWFETMEDYDVYAEHPDHLEFIDNFSYLWADVKVYDSDIIYVSE
jgi:hypothetical protein